VTTKSLTFATHALLLPDGSLVMHDRWPTLPMCFPTRKGAVEEMKSHSKAVKVVRVKIDATWRAKP